VIFDLWNTLIHDPSKEIHEKIANLLKFENRQDFWDYCDKNFFHKKITFYKFLKELIEQRKLPEKTFDKIKKLWEESKKHVNLFPDTIETLGRLKKNYKLVLLSNTSKEEGREAIAGLDIEKYFDNVIFSCEIGLAKPNPKIFQLIIESMNVKPEEIVMIGDNLEMDIVPARMLGFKTFLIDTRKKYTEYQNENWYVNSLKELKL